GTGGELCRGQGRISDTGEEQRVAFLALRPRRQLCVRIDGDDLHVRVETRSGCPLERKIQRLAQQQHKIGALGQVGQRSERGIGQTARALQNDCRRAGRGFELCQQIASARARQLRAGKDERTFRGGEGGKNLGAV